MREDRRAAPTWPIHLDGARLFNAAVALGRRGRRSCPREVDSVTFCLSKGLCAPVGSVLTGSRELIDRARRVRKSLGGGMRQVGVLAAAGIVALERMIDRLEEDHAHARRLADGLAGIPGIRIEPDRVRTNIAHFEIDPGLGIDAAGLVRRLRDEHGILLGPYTPGLLRAVTHYWVGEAEVRALLDAVRSLVAATP